MFILSVYFHFITFCYLYIFTLYNITFFYKKSIVYSTKHSKSTIFDLLFLLLEENNKTGSPSS